MEVKEENQTETKKKIIKEKIGSHNPKESKEYQELLEERTKTWIEIKLEEGWVKQDELGRKQS